MDTQWRRLYVIITKTSGGWVSQDGPIDVNVV
jgi:hypothetical protein